ncbi:MAG: hypothetical protein AAFX02_01300 [Pseudomonadota bacterium]
MTTELLRSKLSAFTGANMSALGEIEAQFKDFPNYIGSLIELAEASEGMISSGATWLLKSSLEQGTELTDHQLARLIEKLPNITDWSAQLHACQSVRHLSLSSGAAKSITLWAETLLDHKRPFLRAWSLDALCVAANIAPILRADAQVAFKKAGNDNAASVRARARNLGQEFGFLT